MALPSFSSVFGLLINSTKEDIVPLVISNNVMIPKCIDLATNAVVPQVTKEVCESVTSCPFTSCGNEGCFYCNSTLNCSMIDSDADGYFYDNTTCPTNVMCGKANQAMLKSNCDNIYECDINCPDCNSTEVCTANGVCEGYPVHGVICAVPSVLADCPATCSYDKLMDMCLCKDSSAQVAAKFNVSISNNNFTVPLNAVPNTFCPLGYWELAPPNNVDACHAFKGCFNPQNGLFNSLSTCKDSSCTNGVVIKNVYNFRNGNWVKASQKELKWDVTKPVASRKWVWSLNPESQIPAKVYTTMVANMKPDLVAKKMTCLTNMQENVITFTSCKCGDGSDPACSNMKFLTFTDSHIVVPAGADKNTVSDSLSFGFITVPPQVSFNDVKFVEARTTFRNPNTVVIVNNATKSAVGVLFGNGYSFDNDMTGVKLCLNKVPSPLKTPLPSKLGFAKDTGSGPVEMNIPISVNGASICAQLDIAIDTVYYPMNYELPPNPNNENNGNGTQPMPSCFGLLANNTNACSGNGKCIANDTCQCNPSFTGKNCEINNNNNNQPMPSCFGLLANDTKVCSGNGKCITNDTCQCNGGFNGKNCEINNNNNNQPMPSCFGFLSNNTKVCSGNGKCISNDTCQCNGGFNGKNCEIAPSCFGLLANNTNVCSGNGKCIGIDACQCNGGFSGKSCEINNNNNQNILSCFGILSNNSKVCSGNGKCIDIDYCQCNAGFTGKNCEINSNSNTNTTVITCKGVAASSLSVCSGGGKCIAQDVCQCNTTRYGANCENFVCYSKTVGSCSGNGLCSGPDKCVCKNGWAGGFWAGSNCEICQPNYGGADCKSLACNANVTCLGRGTCNADTTCSCTGNFAGPFCRTCIASWYGPSCNVTCDPMKKCSGNGFCTANGACSCISNNLLGMYAGESCSSCASGWSGSKCNIKLGSSATFGSIGDRVSFEFAFPSLTNNIDCAVVLSESSLKAVGSAPICRWDDRSKNSFQIILGSAASLLPGDALQVKNNDNAFGSVSVTSSGSSFLPPSAELRGPKNVSSCTTFLFDASASVSVDRRPLKFVYSISGPGSLTAASASLALVGGSFGYLDASLLSNGEFTMSVTVTNGFNLTAISSFKFTVSSTPSVIVRIPGGASQSVNMGSLYSILPIVEYPSCFFSDRTLIWTWSQESGPATATMTLRDNNRVAIFLENAFPSAGTYSFKVRAVAKASPASSYETTVTLQVIATDLVLMITGGTTRKASVTTSFAIDFTRSYDPARDASTDTFSATCTNLLTNSACSYSMSGVISNKVATFPAASLPEGEYSIVITYTKGSRTASQEVYVSMVGYAVLTASIRLTRNDWIPSSIPLGENIPLIVDVLNYVPAQENPINFTWSSLTEGFTLSEGSTTISKTSGRSLLISGKALSADTTYSVRVDVSTQNAGGYSVFEFTVNSPPLPGAISASPASSTAGLDTVTVTCSGWYDSNSPLTYQFFFYDAIRGIWSTLSGRTTDNQVQAKLPPSPAADKKLRIRARVFDSKNAFSDIETSVISNPPDLTSGSAALNFLNQSANVADSTASSAAAVSSLSSISNQNLAAEVVTQVKAFLVNVISSVLSKQSQVAVSVEDAAETISFISAAVNSLDLVDSNTRGQMLQSTASSLTALANSDKPISSDLANSIASSLSNFIKNILSSSGISTRSAKALRSLATDSQSVLDSAASLLAGMSKNQLLDQAASISSSSEFIVYTKKISASSTASYSEVIANNTQYQLPANFTAGFSSSITSIGVNIKQLSNLYKAIYSQSMTIMSKLFELSLENADTGAKLSLNGVKIGITLSGNFTLGTSTSKYDCLLWNNSTKVFSKDSSCSVSIVSSSSATIQVSQSGTYAVSRSIATGTSTVTPTASKSTTVITPKTSKSKVISAGSTNFAGLLAIVFSVLSVFLI
ncbi:basal body protein NBP family [Naegleria gruberi]|uniref:Basal body protein NBP family n=1 Tax=Naegleria gruberi TaxID=5762 RepID=D2V765_NAEGR|nr:basal body protein NBP family [Naegleria gruberi]EFC47318.1 basal body protein NBP family [Naegleria gruberi]|eukprot:XP_002680062.1 basal body protein NBP family [Naegleria gruberi strain NEG-M]